MEYHRLLDDRRRVHAFSEPELLVLKVPLAHETQLPIHGILDTQGHLRSGLILAQSPFDPNEYAPLAEASEAFAVSKALSLAELAKLLGATRVSFSQTKELVQRRRIAESVRVKVLRQGEGSTDVERTVDESLKGQIEFEDTFPGGPPDLEAAEAFLAERSISAIPEFASLLRLRSGSNPIARRTLTVDLSREVTQQLEVATRASKALVANGGHSHSHSSKTRSRLVVRMDVTFGVGASGPSRN